jgi:hypothetical protein
MKLTRREEEERLCPIDEIARANAFRQERA